MGGTTLFLLLALFLLLPHAARAQTAPLTAQQIVAAADRVRNPGAPFRLANELIEYVKGQPRDHTGLVVYSKENPATRQFRNLVQYVDPARDQGKMVLMDDTQMWFYDPASKDSVRISPQQRLLGQAADGDVVTVNLAVDYTAKLDGAETLEDADRKNRDTWHLDLAPANDQAVYGRIEYWIERGTYQAVKGKFYSDSGRLLKIAYFHDVQQELGGPRPTQVIIIDGVDTALVTTMNFSDYRFQDIPDSWFQKDFLPRLNLP